MKPMTSIIGPMKFCYLGSGHVAVPARIIGSSGCQSSSINIAVTLDMYTVVLVSNPSGCSIVAVLSLFPVFACQHEGPTQRLRTLDVGVPVCCRVFRSSS